MKERLTKREQGFIKGIAKGESANQAVKNNFNITADNSASAYANKLKKKPKVALRLLSIADQIPDKLLVEKHLELLNAEKITKIMKKGEYTEIEELVDNQAISKGLDMAYKIKGTYAPDKSVNLNLNGDIIANKDLEDLAKQLNEIARNNNRTNITGDGIDAHSVDKKA